MANVTKAQVEQKLKSLNVNRPVSDQDVANANKFGMAIFDKTFGGSSASATNTAAAQTPAQAGQAASQPTASVTGLPTQAFKLSEDKSAQQQLEELTGQGAAVSQLIQKGLQRVQSATPFEENKMKARARLGGLTLEDYKGMPIADAISAMQKDIAMEQSKIQYFDAKKAEAQGSADQLVSGVANWLNSQIQALGLRVQKEESDRAFAEQQRQFNASLARQGSGRNTTLIKNADGSQSLIDANTGDIIKTYGSGEKVSSFAPSMSFDDYLNQKQNEAGQSFDQGLIDQTRSEYEKMIANEKTQHEVQAVSLLSPLTQAIYNNPAGYSDLTATEKGNVQSELQSVGLSPELLGVNRADALRKEYTSRPEYKTFLTIRDNYNRIQASSQDPSGAGDLSLIYSYMKLLDPTSVVREGEFATAQNSGGIDDRIRSTYNNILNGERLSQDQRNDFVDRANKLYTPVQNQKAQLDSEYKTLAENQGIDPNSVVFTGSSNSSSTSDFTDIDAFLNSIP